MYNVVQYCKKWVTGLWDYGITRVRLLGLWLGGALRIGWSAVRFMGSPVVTVTNTFVHFVLCLVLDMLQKASTSS